MGMHHSSTRLRTAGLAVQWKGAVLLMVQKDRLARISFYLLEHLGETHSSRLLARDTHRRTQPMQQDRVQDLMALSHWFSSRLYGLRNSCKALKKALANENRAQNTDQPYC